MARKKRCPRCGNVIPEWSHGVCPVCGRITSTERRFWKGGRKPFAAPSPMSGTPSLARSPTHRPKKRRSAPIPTRRPKEPETTPIAAYLRQSKTYPNYARQSPEYRRVYGFNRLLHDVYGRPIRLSHILLRRGIPAVQVFRWRQNTSWLPHYLRRLRLKLMILLRTARPKCNPFVLSMWYALDGEGQHTKEAIARELQITGSEIDDTRRAFLAYLKSPEGRVAFEKVVCDAADEVGQS